MAFQPNQRVFTRTEVNLRATPGYQGDPPPTVVRLLPARTACTVTGSAREVDGLTWWPLRVSLPGDQEATGWAAERVGDEQLLEGATPVQPPPPVVRGNRLGFYLHATNNDLGLWEAIGRVQPPVILMHHDAANDMLLNEIRAFRAPEALVVGRFYITNDEQRALLESGDPAGEGRRFAERILQHDFGKFTRRAPSGRLLIDAWMSLNECLPGPASDSYREQPARYHALYAAYDRFQVAFRERLQQEGVEAVAFNFAAGNFNQGAHYLDHFPGTLASYTYLGFHEYGWPSLLPGQGASGAGLFRDVLEAARSRFGRRYQVIITEAGLTRAYGHPQNPDEGWLNQAESLDENSYWESLAWYNSLLDQEPDVVGACLYQVGHRGDWATFRHLGKDNQGRDLHLVDRLVALREATTPRPAIPAAAPRDLPNGRFTLRGRVRSGTTPVAGAQVRLVGDLATLGAMRGAVIDRPGAVSWSRRVTGFAGSLRTAWDRFVAGQVAGLTWDEFAHDVLLANPSLAATGNRFRADATYFLPETNADAPAFVWDRTVDGYAGSLHQLWLDLVQGKVLGMSYAAFRRQFGAYNPAFVAAGGELQAEQPYLLPRTVAEARYVLTATTTERGYFRFSALPAGDYRIEIVAPGMRSLFMEITLADDITLLFQLEALLPVEGAEDEATGAGDGRDTGGQFMGTLGREFVVDGKFFRFIGVNLRGLVYYGMQRSQMLQHTQESHRQEFLDQAQAMGVRVVRVFLPYIKATTDETIDMLRRTLRLLGERRMYLIPAFVDFYSTTDFRIPGDDHFYEKLDPNFDPQLLNGAFYRGGYRERYLPFVRAVVEAFVEDPRIFAWEIGNELKYQPAEADPGRATFLDFMLTVARTIKEIDPNHLVTTGLISSSHPSLNEGERWRALYGGSEFDFLTIHCYNEQYDSKPDYDYAKRLEKPFIIEEAGFGHERPGDRVQLVRNDMERWFGFGASGYMQWGFMPTFGDNGDGDQDSGMDRKWHGHDFDSLFTLYRDRAAALQAQVDSMPRPLRPDPRPHPVDPDTFAVGQTVFAQTIVRLRQEPGTAKPVDDTLTMLNPGQAATVTGPSTPRDGLTWWPIRVTLGAGSILDGWAAQATAGELLLAATMPPAPPQ